MLLGGWISFHILIGRCLQLYGQKNSMRGEASVCVIPILKWEKLRHRVVRWCVQGSHQVLAGYEAEHVHLVLLLLPAATSGTVAT